MNISLTLNQVDVFQALFSRHKQLNHKLGGMVARP